MVIHIVLKMEKYIFIRLLLYNNGLYNSSIYINCSSINNIFMKVRYSIYILDKNTNLNKYSSQLKNNQVINNQIINDLNNLNEIDICYNNNLNIDILQTIKNIYNVFKITFINMFNVFNLLLSI